MAAATIIVFLLFFNNKQIYIKPETAKLQDDP
jgi:hypothetical protein